MTHVVAATGSTSQLWQVEFGGENVLPDMPKSPSLDQNPSSGDFTSHGGSTYVAAARSKEEAPPVLKEEEEEEEEPPLELWPLRSPPPTLSCPAPA